MVEFIFLEKLTIFHMFIMAKKQVPNKRAFRSIERVFQMLLAWINNLNG